MLFAPNGFFRATKKNDLLCSSGKPAVPGDHPIHTGGGEVSRLLFNLGTVLRDVQPILDLKVLNKFLKVQKIRMEST